MKKGQMYTHVTSENNPDHPLVKELAKKGWSEIDIVYASHWSTDSGWTLSTATRNNVGISIWLGFTIAESLININKWDKF